MGLKVGPIPGRTKPFFQSKMVTGPSVSHLAMGGRIPSKCLWIQYFKFTSKTPFVLGWLGLVKFKILWPHCPWILKSHFKIRLSLPNPFFLLLRPLNGYPHQPPRIGLSQTHVHTHQSIGHAYKCWNPKYGQQWSPFVLCPLQISNCQQSNGVGKVSSLHSSKVSA